MNRKTKNALKTLCWVACLFPLCWLIWGAATNNLGPDPTATIAFVTGLEALRLLMITLAITPLRKLWARLAWLIHFRRLLGLFAFFYATLHMLTYIVLYAGLNLNEMLADVTKRRFITAGVLTWLLLMPLAATSTTWAIRKLGGKRWNRLHTLIYAAAIGGVVHYWWQVKPGVWTPAGITIVLFILLAIRPILRWMERYRTRARQSVSGSGVKV